MSNIKLTWDIKRFAILDPQLTKGRIMVVGTFDMYEKHEDHIDANIRLNEGLDATLLETIEKNPGCLRVYEQIMPAKDIMLIPSRPKLII